MAYDVEGTDVHPGHDTIIASFKQHAESTHGARFLGPVSAVSVQDRWSDLHSDHLRPIELHLCVADSFVDSSA